MQIAILGATGRIGAHLLGWALDAGHPVHTLARHPEALPQRPGPTVTRGDALDAAAVTEVIAGAGAALSALGPRGARTPSGLRVGAAPNIGQPAGVSTSAGVRAAGASI